MLISVDDANEWRMRQDKRIGTERRFQYAPDSSYQHKQRKQQQQQIIESLKIRSASVTGTLDQSRETVLLTMRLSRCRRCWRHYQESWPYVSEMGGHRISSSRCQIISFGGLP